MSASAVWHEANRAWLQLQVRRVRLLLALRVAWLRRRWGDAATEGAAPGVVSEAEADRLLQGDDPAAERAFREGGEAGPDAEALAEVEAELQALGAALADAGAPPALRELERRFGLSPFEADVLALCMAAEVEPPLARLMGYVQDDLRAACPTPALACTLFLPDGDERLDGLAAFAATAPLRARRLVRLGEGAAGAPAALRPLALEEPVAGFLRGAPSLDERVAEVLRPLEPGPAAPAHAELAAALARMALEDGLGPRPAVNLAGPDTSAAEDVTRLLCARLGLRPRGVQMARLAALGPAERAEVLRLLARDAALAGMGLHAEVDGAEGAAAELAERFEGLLVLASRERWGHGRDLATLPVPALDAEARRALWDAALAEVPHTAEDRLDAIVQQFPLGPAAVTRAVASAGRAARLAEGGGARPVDGDALWDACRAQAARGMEALARRVAPAAGWRDLVLPDESLSQLREIATQVEARAQVYDAWGFGARLGRGRGIAALFAGPSGTGKTLAAEVLASHLRLDLYRVDLAGVVSKYIGETEKNLRQVFDAAEEGGAILFFDEADALFGRRTEVRDSHDRYANIEVNYLLQRMEEYRGLAILATNRKQALDRAFLRRLRFLVDFPMPDADSRRRIWRRMFPDEAALEDLDFGALARMEIPGGNIRGIVVNAAFLAAGEGVPIGMRHVALATRREYAKLEKSMGPAELALVPGPAAA